MVEAVKKLNTAFLFVIKIVLIMFGTVMTVLVITNVILRYGFRSGLTWSEEACRFLFIWTTFLGAILGESKGAHMRLDFIVDAFPGVSRKIVQVIALLYTRFVFRMQNKKQQCDLSYAMISPNTGFFGSPIAESIFGPVGLMLTCIYLIPQRLVMWSVGLSMFTGVSEKRTAVRKLITHPCVIACILGLLFMVLKLPFPDWILSPVRMIGRCNTPISMLVIGMIVSKVSLKALANKTVIMFSIHRLFVVPAIIFIVCCLLPVSRTVFGVSVLLAAMPAGATTSMLASKYDKDPVFAAELVVFSTICSIPAILAWMLFIS